MADRKHVTVYTDGACEGNPGPGGYGVVLIHGGARKELSGGFRLTTNNRMELFAAIYALEALKEPCAVTLFSDSKYLVKAMQLGWAQRWMAMGWKTSKKGAAANPDLWRRLLALCEQHKVEFAWVKGHAGDPNNERCDRLSYAAIRSGNLVPDQGYEARAADHPQ